LYKYSHIKRWLFSTYYLIKCIITSVSSSGFAIYVYPDTNTYNAIQINYGKRYGIG